MKSFFRFLSNNRLYTLIELFGLTVSLAFVIYMGCYMVQQLGVAHEHPDGDRIYVLGMPKSPGLTWGFPGKIRNRFPEIEVVAEYYPSLISAGEGFVLKNGEEQVEVGNMITVDSSFFHLFPDCHFLMGGPEVLKGPEQIILSESFARKLFPNGSTVIGESVHGVLSYMKLILVSSIIALPFSVWTADKYLEQFIVKIENYSWIYVVTLVLIFLIALLTTIWQMGYAARVNPVEVLNKE